MIGKKVIKINVEDIIDATEKWRAESVSKRVPVNLTTAEYSRLMEMLETLQVDARGEVLKISVVAREILMLAADQVLKIKKAPHVLLALADEQYSIGSTL